MFVRYLAQQDGEQGYQEGEQVYQEGEYIQGGVSQDYVHEAADGYQLAHPQSFDVHPDDAQQVRVSFSSQLPASLVYIFGVHPRLHPCWAQCQCHAVAAMWSQFWE